MLEYTTAQKRPSSALQQTDVQFELLGSVLDVQVIPSGDVAATAAPFATVQNNPSSALQQTEIQP